MHFNLYCPVQAPDLLTHSQSPGGGEGLNTQVF